MHKKNIENALFSFSEGNKEKNENGKEKIICERKKCRSSGKTRVLSIKLNICMLITIQYN